MNPQTAFLLAMARAKATDQAAHNRLAIARDAGIGTRGNHGPVETYRESTGTGGNRIKGWYAKLGILYE